MNEFDIIEKYFAPLTDADLSSGLKDDVARLPTAATDTVSIVTADTIIEGVHFLATDPLDTVAQKLMRVNVSDVVAKGGQPRTAILCVSWPKTRPIEDIAVFAEGLTRDLRYFGVRLLGGDTTRTPGPMTLSLTLIGECGASGPVTRSGAKAGDDIWCTGVIGDGYLGLKCLTGDLQLTGDLRDGVVNAYRLPAPAVDAAQIIKRYASAAIDVSDGLFADLGHILKSSNVGGTLIEKDIPLSPAGSEWLKSSGQADKLRLLSGGDDYQCLFTASPSMRAAILKVANNRRLQLSCIGSIEAGQDLKILRVDGGLNMVEADGWSHF